MFGGRKQAQRDWVTRYEAKYVIPRSLVPQFRAFIAPFCVPDPYGHGNPPEYSITTLQLDDPGYSLHYAKEREALTRFKLRVRTYGEIGSSPVFTEVKAKLEQTIVKTRAAIPFSEWSRELVFGVKVPACFKSVKQEVDFLQFRRLVWELGARPVLLVRYLRESYVGAMDRYARVTFDRALEYQMSDSWTDFGRSGAWHKMDSAEAQGFGLTYSGVILEVKTLSHLPVWVVDMVERFQLKKVGNCKYSTALWREGRFCGFPETNDEAAEALAQV